ncbi:gag protease polyprotein [Cucumis melo var. makuwa]|uniref:Gag protease polyprotein n=1 Tax=Cucumis melo var. makuwa TaxID=1194695 RepID=A0A5D3BVM3_CUCMM|nr:gag protease polyprotein [Cucumis melo var. makuwa]
MTMEQYDVYFDMLSRFAPEMPATHADALHERVDSSKIVEKWSTISHTRKAELQPTVVPQRNLREYPDVFTDELPRLLTHREIDFVIELELNTVPISRAPYRMAPTKLKELKVQLQELLDKGFI